MEGQLNVAWWGVRVFRFLLLCEVGVGRVVVEQEFRLERSHLRVSVCLVCLCVCVCVCV